MIIIIHVIFSFSLKRPRFYKFCKTSFLFLYIIFVMKINIVFVFDSVNDGQNIFVSVIVTVTEISLHTHTHTMLIWHCVSSTIRIIHVHHNEVLWQCLFVTGRLWTAQTEMFAWGLTALSAQIGYIAP